MTRSLLSYSVMFKEWSYINIEVTCNNMNLNEYYDLSYLFLQFFINE